MNRALKFFIEEIDYYIEVDWLGGESPQVGDFVQLVELCTAEQSAEFEKMPIPKYLHADFPTTLDYLSHYRWRVVERCWCSNSNLTINCRRVDPTLL